MPLDQQADNTDQEAEQEHGGDGNRGYVDSAALPEFPSNRPVHQLGPRDRRGGYFVRPDRRIGHDVRFSTHRATPCASITATNKSATLGLRTSPRAAAR